MRSKPILIKAVPSSGSPYKMTNFNRGVPGVARSNNCRGLLVGAKNLSPAIRANDYSPLQLA